MGADASSTVVVVLIGPARPCLNTSSRSNGCTTAVIVHHLSFCSSCLSVPLFWKQRTRLNLPDDPRRSHPLLSLCHRRRCRLRFRHDHQHSLPKAYELSSRSLINYSNDSVGDLGGSVVCSSRRVSLPMAYSEDMRQRLWRADLPNCR